MRRRKKKQKKNIAFSSWLLPSNSLQKSTIYHKMKLLQKLSRHETTLPSVNMSKSKDIAAKEEGENFEGEGKKKKNEGKRGKKLRGNEVINQSGKTITKIKQS